MREVAFLKQNADKWKQFEEILKDDKGADPDILANLFIQLTDDLSYGKTFFPDSKTTKYLNSLTAKYHQAIYKNKREEKSIIKEFFTFIFPITMRRHHKKLLYAFLIFTLAITMGAISSAGDKSFVKLILGERYVHMTTENIEKGDPMAVYKDANQVNMFLGITINNIRVALTAFIVGIGFSVFTGYILFSNGVMLGAFQYFFYTQGLFLVSFKTIWIHGTLEISSILVAGCAGLVVGNSILFPGTYSRKQSFVYGLKDGLIIFLSTVPLFIVAGFLEGFVTRYTEIPGAVSYSIIGISCIFVLFYFIIYPIYVSRKEILHVESSEN